MPALIGDRDTKTKEGVQFAFPLKAATQIFAGAMGAIDATGFAVPAAAVVTHKVVGPAMDRYNNLTGANGDIKGEFRRGVAARYNNSTAGDLVVLADVGALCYVVDDNTVAKTSATNTRPAAGKIVDVDALGVWVDFR
jgi:hypothetical protein